MWQDNRFPPRDAEGCWLSRSGRKGPAGCNLGPLKWGVGKLVASCPRAPIVIPIYHWGLNDMMPLDENNNNKHLTPCFGKHVRVEVGDPVKLDDIMSEYLADVARVQKQGVSACELDGARSLAEWQDARKHRLYAALTDRIQQAMLELEHKVHGCHLPKTGSCSVPNSAVTVCDK